MPNIGMMELLILAFLGVLIFGKKLPEVGKSLGQGIVSFKKGLQGVETHIDDAMNVPDPVKKKKKKKRKLVEGEAAMAAQLPESAAAVPSEPASDTPPQTPAL